MFKPEGVFPAMLGSYSKDYRINGDATKKMVDFYIDRKVSGLFPLSSVGGFAHLSMDQRKEMIDIITEQNNGRVPVAPGAGSTYPGPVIELSKHAAAAGCSAIVVCGPYYYTATPSMVEEHFTRIADESPIPVILYNIPNMATPVTPPIVEKLMNHGNIVGIKDSSGAMAGMTDMVAAAQQQRANFHPMTGIDKVFYPMLAVGAVGCMTAGTTVVPEVTVAIYNQFKAGNHDKARKIQLAYLPLMNMLGRLPFPYGYNAALESRGIDMGVTIQPLSQADQALYQQMKPEYQKTIQALLDEVAVIEAE